MGIHGTLRLFTVQNVIEATLIGHVWALSEVLQDNVVLIKQ